MQTFATTTDLLSHQQDAVNRMLPTRIGALFMEQGTGKSRTAIELAKLRAKKIDRVVWFCPVSLKATVYGEIRKHTDASDICVFDDRITQSTIPAARWYIIGIESLSASARVVLATHKLIDERTMVILDESGYCKSHQALRTQRITRFAESARYRLAMTGTPITQGIIDLYAQMRFLSPKILGYSSFYSFAANHLEYSEKFPGMVVRSHNTAWLAAKMRPYVYQVTKAECFTLPPKQYEGAAWFWMTSAQRSAYEAVKEEAFAEMMEDRWDSLAIFRLFTHLQQIVSGFLRMRGNQQSFPHYRIDTLMETIAEAPDAKTIIWAKYHYDIQSIVAALHSAYGRDSVALLYGPIQERDRAQEVGRFRTAAQFLVATQSTAGHGFTFNEAERVIFYTNGFKYSERQQAEDRCHRYGQDHAVSYVDITCAQSIDDRIVNALINKQSVVRQFRQEIDKVKKDHLRKLVNAL